MIFPDPKVAPQPQKWPQLAKKELEKQQKTLFSALMGDQTAVTYIGNQPLHFHQMILSM